MRKSLVLLLLFSLGVITSVDAQISVPNIDFETGTNANWNYYKGIYTSTGFVLTSCSPVPTLHDITSGGTDLYGGFPVVGKGMHSLKLNKDTIHYNAVAADYHIHVPTTGNYSLQYRYALVMEDPHHSSPDQPRFEIDIKDSATGSSISCYPYKTISGLISGGSVSTVTPFPIYLPWTQMISDLSSYKGRTLIFSFKVGACALGEHWGYAYIDVDTLVNNVISKPVTCHNVADTFTGPAGYGSYTWYDAATFSHIYGTSKDCIIPLPSTETKFAVVVNPSIGFGCPDTLYTEIDYAFKLSKTPDATVCLGSSISLTSGATSLYPPLSYSWSPGGSLSCTTCDPVTATPPSGSTFYKFTVTDADGCSLKDSIKVTTTTTPAMILAPPVLCTGLTVTLSTGISGGVWSSGTTAVAIIGSSSGVATGIGAGTSSITYSAGACTGYGLLIVSASPASITGSAVLCAGSTTMLSDATPGGTWNSSNTSIATVGSTSGVVTGIAAGAVTITYHSGPCYSTLTMTVKGSPGPISGLLTLCTGGSTVTLTDATTGGTWSSSNTNVSIDIFTGVTSPVAAGSSEITYTIPSGCFSLATVSVIASPVAISGALSMCVGSTTTLSDAVAGGIWSTGIGSATIGSTSGIVSGSSAGTTIISYTTGGSCYVTETVTVVALPSIFGPATVDVTLSTTYTGIAGGGTWSSSDPSVASVGSTSGIVTGVSVGTATITYLLSSGCAAYKTVSVVTHVNATNVLLNEHLRVYPNPVKNEVNIAWNSIAIDAATIIVTDVIGREIYRGTLTSKFLSGEERVDLRGILPGIYQLIIDIGGDKYINKLIIK